MRIVVVEDEYFSRKALIKSLILIDGDIEITGEFENGKEASESEVIANADLVITDIRMPEMDGLALAGDIYAKYPDVHVMIQTGFADFSYAQQAIRFHVCNYLLKPVKDAELADAVKRISEEIRLEELKVEQKVAERLNAGGGLDPECYERLHKGWERDSRNLRSTTEESEIISKMKDYVRLHYAENISLGELAVSQFFMNASYLSRYFKAETGTNFSRYLTEYRIRCAKEMLVDHRIRVSDVAINCGFNSLSHFGEVFKKQTGKTPEQYRKEH